MKIYDMSDAEHPGIISSRIRLLRNLDSHVFPSRLSPRESVDLIRRVERGLTDLGSVNERHYRFRMLNDMSDLERESLLERHVVNSAAEECKSPVGILLSDDEECGVVIGGTDHIRIQIIGSGLCLEALWDECNKIDDYIDLRFPYAFDEKYGYLTSFPTNVGTGMKAAVVLHLPRLSRGKNFQGLTAETARFGGTIRGLYGEGNENFGSFYEISNQKTLGVTEGEIIDLVSRLALQLISQERHLRELNLEKRHTECEDEAYRSYGILRYARTLTLKDAMINLSRLMQGLEDGIIKIETPSVLYTLMLDIQPASLQKNSDRPFGKDELDAARADHVRAVLPKLEDV